MGGALLAGASSIPPCRRPAKPASMAWQAGPCAARRRPGKPSTALTAAVSHRGNLDSGPPAHGRHITVCGAAKRLPAAFAFAVLVALVALSLLCPCATAAGTNGALDPRLLLAPHEIVYDRSFPPQNHHRMPLAPHHASKPGSELDARDPDKTTAAAKTAVTADGSSTAPALPQPFDTSLGSNFTSPGCPTFFDDFLANSTFQSCVPLSLLLQTSSGFFQDTASVVRTTQVLDASCNANVAACAGLMDYYATEILKDDNCGADYQLNNPTVVEAYEGLVAYKPVYQAGCLKAASGSYCFANAITNASSPTDSYPYYLPLGVPLPGGSRPTCNACLKMTMNAFWGYTSNSTQPISQTYSDAASQVNINCGPTFINGTNAVARSGAASGLSGRSGLSATVGLLVTLALFLV